ncbi:site-specific integrase [Streptomyces sp. CC219B]|uniref:site-specific integrase n=1 Tax=Streptomyces sp. CC219B TaxID=3044574 RepID=UPI0024A8B8CD|nr:site-specific integrase [Streptomyces sp. CC219B]
MPASRRAGSVYKRCECRGPGGKLLSNACPQLAKKNHGRYAIRQELPPTDEGKRRTFRRTGYGGSKEAQSDLSRIQAVLDLASDDEDAARRVGDLLQGVMRDRADIPDVTEVKRKLGVGVPLDGAMLVSDWLDVWLAAKKTRPTTTNSYASHVRYHLKPRIGHHRLDRLNVGHLVEMFDGILDDAEVIAAENTERRAQEARCTRGRPGAPKASERARLAEERAKLKEMKPYRRVTGPQSLHAIRRTLRTALNAAIARQLITFNPAAHVELKGGARPKPVLWTDGHVRRWREAGEKPGPVMVWTPQQFGQFLDQAEEDDERLYALFCVMGFRGLRRGEAVGQDWADVHLDEGLITVSTELVVDGWAVIETAPKTEGSAATIALDKATVQVLRAHRKRQLEEKLKAGAKWKETGKVFTTETGEWLHPDLVSKAFRRIAEKAGLPPINLRDLRHIAATLIHAGGGDLHAIKETLRHGTIKLASDTYTSLLPEVDREIAEKAAAVVPRARRAGGVRAGE